MSALYCYREILAGSEWGSVKEMKGCGYVLALALIFSLGTINRGAYHELIYIWLGAGILVALMLVLKRRAQKIADQEYEEAQKKTAESQAAKPVQAPEKAVIDSYAFEKDTEIIRVPKEMHSEDRDKFFCPDGPYAFPYLDELRKKKIETVSLNGVNAGWITDLSRLFVGFENVKQIDMTGFSSSEATSMHNMFYECEKLVSVDFTGFDTSYVTDMSGMFWRCIALPGLDCSSFDTSKVTDMRLMFCGCWKLKHLNLSGFDTSKVRAMDCMFSGCERLDSLDVKHFNTANVTDMSCMFNRCASLLSLDLTGFDTSKVRRMNRMFDSCGLLTELDLSSFDTRNVETMKEMFKNCTNLARLDLSGFDFSNVKELGNMFSGCDGLKEVVLSDTVLKCMGERETGRTITKYEPRSESEMEPVYAYGAQSRSQVYAYSDPYKAVTEKEVEKVPFSKLSETEKKKWLGLSEKACLTIVRHAKPASSGSPVSRAPEEKKQETPHKAPEQRVRNEDFEIRDRVLIKYKGNESHVTVPDGVERIRENAFTAIEKFMEWVGRPGDEGVVTFEEERPLKYIREIDLPDSVTVIEEGALAQCENLERIRFGKNIREIKAFEFSGCRKLKTVVVSEETRIGERAFRKETEIIRAPKE